MRAFILKWAFFALINIFHFGSNVLSAKVINIDIDEKLLVMGGQTFGNAGAYQWITGTITFGVDPSNEINKNICDLDLAVSDAYGLIISKTKFIVLHPIHKAKGNGTALIEVSNRGGKSMMQMYCHTSGGDLRPNVPKDFGNSFLLRQGFTLVWLGWQWDVPKLPNALKLEVPTIKNKDGTDINGLVRTDWVIDEPISTLSLGHRNMIGYPVADPNSSANVLTSRNGLLSSKNIIPNSDWSFSKLDKNGIFQKDSLHITMHNGFKPGFIYELVYMAKNPVLAGLGLTAIRDIASYIKYDPSCEFSTKSIVAQGISQTGRFLRHFLYEGFNKDESGRPVFDGMMIYMAGAGRGSFNHRFAQPSRDGHRFSSFDYPVDIYPFSTTISRDQLLQTEEPLIPADENVKIFFINTGYEYWGRAASLIHTDPGGRHDLSLPSNERYFHISSMQHFTETMPDLRSKIDPRYDFHKGNPLYTLPYFKALLMQMQDWIQSDQLPALNLIPQIKDGSLISPGKYKPPYIPGLDLPVNAYAPSRLYFGPQWKEHKIINQEPPLKSEAYSTLVPNTDQLGNELSGVRAIEIRVPLGTYTPWSLRYKKQNERELDDFRGLFIPLPSKKPSTFTHDRRPLLSELYKNKEEYLSKIDFELTNLVTERFLLQEDVADLRQRSASLWDWIQTYYK